MPDIKVNAYKKLYERIFFRLTKNAAISIQNSIIISGKNRDGGTKLPTINPIKDIANDKAKVRITAGI